MIDNRKEMQKKLEEKIETAPKLNTTMMGAYILFFILAALIMWGLFTYFSPKPVTGAKEIGVQIVYAEDQMEEITLHTDAEYLGEALEEQDLIEGEQGPYGLYVTTVCGWVANEAENEFWSFTKDGMLLETGVDMTPIQDGDHFEITLETW